MNDIIWMPLFLTRTMQNCLLWLVEFLKSRTTKLLIPSTIDLFFSACAWYLQLSVRFYVAEHWEHSYTLVLGQKDWLKE